MKVLVVGAGFAGAVAAERFAAAGHRVDVIDRRPHVAGNAYDERDAHGIRVHRYGPHIFHTDSRRIFAYLSRFTDWHFYEHRVLADLGDRRVPFPINRLTLNQVYGLDLDSAGAEAFIAARREPRTPVATSEDVVLAGVGRELGDLFYRGYTRKQWGLDLAELSAGVAARIPVRFDDDDRYFTDSFQFMPAEGYTAMFERMLASPRIDLRLGVHFDRAMQARYDLTVYSGPLDAYFDHCFGRLPYRSLRFEHEHLAGVAFHQEVAQVNYPNAEAFTRVTEFKHFTGETRPGTSIMREYPQAEGEPYYPIPRPENEALFRRYDALARAEPDVIFVGRLAQYRYYNMDQVVAAALRAVERRLEPAG